ncbi:hypothetical protein SKAU_G00078760 [Synaphobranchus kaupii]|uniref:Thrombopoietin n=1 Tax=Synaphobranchus kaupii TaxID=118154 RepID=A0A9Q1J5E0_SYNKA|nr:hypothetical protein SKAU_G00078760 [Synaphobranchus kaupii]
MENRPVNYGSNATVTVPPAHRSIMDLNRVLLLLLYMSASKVQDVQTRPNDFVCDLQARRSMNKVEEMKSAMGECEGSSLLPSAIPLPCVKVNMGAWGKKSLQEKRAQVLAALKTLAEGLQRVRAKIQNGCQSTLLERLEHSVTNYRHIVERLEILDGGAPSHLARPQHHHHCTYLSYE